MLDGEMLKMFPQLRLIKLRTKADKHFKPFFIFKTDKVPADVKRRGSAKTEMRE